MPSRCAPDSGDRLAPHPKPRRNSGRECQQFSGVEHDSERGRRTDDAPAHDAARRKPSEQDELRKEALASANEIPTNPAIGAGATRNAAPIPKKASADVRSTSVANRNVGILEARRRRSASRRRGAVGHAATLDLGVDPVDPDSFSPSSDSAHPRERLP